MENLGWFPNLATMESWILEYSCKNFYHSVITAISKLHKGHLEECTTSPVYLACAYLHQTFQTWDCSLFMRALEILDTLYNTCQGSIPFPVYCELSIGMRKMIMMKALEEKEDSFAVLLKLRQYFPRQSEDKENLGTNERKALRKLEENFRQFYIPLLKDTTKCAAYMKTSYQKDFGDDFIGNLKGLLEKLLDKIHGLLPENPIEKIMCDSDRYEPLLRLSGDSDLRALLKAIHGRKELTEEDLLNLLSILHRNGTVDTEKG